MLVIGCGAGVTAGAVAGLGLNLYQADVIYADMLRHVSKMPEDLFVASEATKQSLFSAIQRAQGR